jgi:hypothetical protein
VIKIKKQVIYLITSPLSKRDYSRFGINRWLDRGWNVKVFDFTKLLNYEFWDYVNGENLSVDFDGLKIIEDEQSAFDLINSLEDGSVFIDFIHISNRIEREIRRVVSDKGVTMKLEVGLLPRKYSSQSVLLRRLKMLLSHPSYFFRAIKSKIRQYLMSSNSPDYLVASGAASNQNSNRENTFVIKAHSFDYDFFLTNNKKIEFNNNILVFLDSDGPYHPDFVHLGIEPYVTAENYYPTMDEGLLQIGNALNYEIKIAAHPRSDYENKAIKYTFSVVEDQTFDLIKQASVIVSHGSTALNWAIMMRKPIILVTTDEMKKSIFNEITEGFADSLGKNIINLDSIPDNYNWKSQLVINENKHKIHTETFIKQSGTPDKLLWDIVIDQMES